MPCRSLRTAQCKTTRHKQLDWKRGHVQGSQRTQHQAHVHAGHVVAAGVEGGGLGCAPLSGAHACMRADMVAAAGWLAKHGWQDWLVTQTLLWWVGGSRHQPSKR